MIMSVPSTDATAGSQNGMSDSLRWLVDDKTIESTAKLAQGIGISRDSRLSSRAFLQALLFHG